MTLSSRRISESVIAFQESSDNDAEFNAFPKENQNERTILIINELAKMKSVKKTVNRKMN